MSAALLSPAEIAELRDDFNSVLVNACAVSAKTQMTDDDDNEIFGYPTVTQTSPCAHMSTGSAIQHGILVDDTLGITKVILFPWDVVVNPGDRIEIDGDGVAWEAAGDYTPLGTYDAGLIVQCVKAGS